MKNFFATSICCDMDAEGKLKFNGGRLVGALIHMAIGFVVGFFVLF